MPAKRLDLQPGQVFGRWTVIKRAETGKGGSRFLSRCACGTEKAVLGTTLYRGKTVSCGCLLKEVNSKRMSQISAKLREKRRVCQVQAYVGKVFGQWTVLRMHDVFHIEARGKKASLVVCRCACGVERPVLVKLLRNGRSTSCGCYRSEAAKIRYQRMVAEGRGLPARAPRPMAPRAAPKPRSQWKPRARRPNLDAAIAKARVRRPKPRDGVKEPRYYPLVSTKERRARAERGKRERKSMVAFISDPEVLGRVVRSVTHQHAQERIEGPEWWGFEENCPFRDNVDPEESEHGGTGADPGDPAGAVCVGLGGT